MTTPTRTEFEAAAYRWMTEHYAVELLKHFPAPRPYCDATEVVHDAIAAAMGWPAVPEQAGWISVEVRLPAEGEQVLVWRRSKWNNVFQDNLAHDPEDGMFWSELGELAAGESVTHWMPLPPAPPAPEQEQPCRD